MPNAVAQQWISKAKEDEQVVVLVKANKGPWGMAAYHIQQAAEKYLKALLVENGIAPPKIHGLPQLLDLIPGHPHPKAVEVAASMTSSFAWITRYPGAPPVAESNVLQAEQDLSTIRIWVLSKM